MNLRPIHRFVSAACAAFALAGCGSDAEPGSGSAEFVVWGEEYIEEGIPATAFADGWSVTFSRFLIVLADVTVADEREGEAGAIRSSRLFDLVTPGPHLVGELSDVAARTWNRVGYSVAAADADTELHASATDADLELVRDAGYSVYVSGNVGRDAETRTFAWGFTSGTRYAECVAEVDGREVDGITVTPGDRESVELTIHGDHLFYDDLASPAALPRFDAMAAADADGDGEVALEELDAVRLVDIAAGTYGTGSLGDVNDLGAFVRAQVSTLGHFRGEGHCVPEAL